MNEAALMMKVTKLTDDLYACVQEVVLKAKSFEKNASTTLYVKVKSGYDEYIVTVKGYNSVIDLVQLVDTFMGGQRSQKLRLVTGVTIVLPNTLRIKIKKEL